jgi:hypothetical protein
MRLAGLIFTLCLSTAASAQSYKERQQNIGNAAMAVEAYEQSADKCHYEPAVGRALSALEQYLEDTQSYAWQKAKREAPYALNGASNMSQIIKGQAGELDCSAYGTFVSNGLFLSLSIAKMDPTLMSEIDRLADGGGRPKTSSASPTPKSQERPTIPNQAFETGSFPMSMKGVGATLKELKGIDSTNAYAAATVTRGDAEEYCTRDPGGMTVDTGGKLTREQCIAETLKSEKTKVYQVKANCQTGKVDDVNGRTLTLAEIQGDGDNRTSVWRDLMGTTFDRLSDPRITILEMQFAMMCPARWKGQQSAVAPAQGQRRDFEGVWAQIEAECADEEGPNTRTLIDLKNPKMGALFEGYENVCRITNIAGQNPAKLSLTCYEFWQNLEANEDAYRTEVTIASHGPQSISLNGKPYVRCLR